MMGQRCRLARLGIAARRRLGFVLACLMALSVTVGIGPLDRAAPAAAVAEQHSAECVEGGVTWRVEFDYVGGLGGAFSVTKLLRDGVDVGQSTTWQLRLDNQPSGWSPNTPLASVVPFQTIEGNIAAIGGGVMRSVLQSPRLVVPDGSCTIYLFPFVDVGGNTFSGPKIAVLGDDLLAQLNDSTSNTPKDWQGYVERELNALGIRAEVEGQGPLPGGVPVPGRRWTDNGATNALARADSNLLDEYRGLLHHDVDGFVLALGMNDALYIAAGDTQAQRNARRDEVFQKLTPLITEMGSRARCIAIVTSPQNPSVLDEHYQWAADQVNNYFRFITPDTPAAERQFFDFGADSLGQPWFEADGIHLNAAGKAEYTEVLRRAAQTCADDVVLWGEPGSLEDSALANANATTLSSGQRWSTHPVDDYGFVPGTSPHFSTITDDGTIFFMNGGGACNVFFCREIGMSISGFNPDTRTFTNIPIRTDRNVAVPQASCGSVNVHPAWAFCQPEGSPWDMGGWIGDVDAVLDGGGVAFTGYQGYWGQDLETQGQFPQLGVVTQRPDGSWGLIEGPDANGDGRPDWRNAWSDRELAQATIDADPQNGQALADALCPVSGTDTAGRPARSCGPWMNEMAVLPTTGDIAIADYGPGKIGIVHIGEPDAAGRLSPRITAVYDLPDVDNPAYSPERPDFPGQPDNFPRETPLLSYTVRELQPDPTTHPDGKERFAAQWEFAPGLTEFRYDPAAPSWQDRIQPTSATVIPGPTHRPSNDPTTAWDESAVRAFDPVGAFAYDQQGNLWFGSYVYANGPNGRKISDECVETDAGGQPIPITDYVSTATGTKPSWGKICPPDYEIQAAKLLGPIYGVEEDPATGNMALTDWAHSKTLIVDPEGSGDNMTFRVGNLATPFSQSTSDVPVSGPCAEDPTPENPPPTCSVAPKLGEMAGPIDSSGRLWIAVQQFIPDGPDGLDTDQPGMAQLDLSQWSYSINLDRLLGGQVHQLGNQPAATAVVQAETMSTTTTATAAGSVADVDIRPTAPVRVCVDRPAAAGWTWAFPCREAPLNHSGLALGGNGNDGGTGQGSVAPGTTAEYQIVVPKAGTYQLTYRATSFSPTNGRDLVMTIDGTGYTTSITGAPPREGLPGGGELRDNVQPQSVTLPAGRYTMTIEAPDGGWQLDWIKFTHT